MKMAKSPATAPLFKALGDYKSILISVGCFTALINVLMLVPSIYMLQVYDRVLSSQNETTLAMLTLMVVGFFAFIGLLEVSAVLSSSASAASWSAVSTCGCIRPRSSATCSGARATPGKRLGDLTHIRQFVTGPALFAFFDAPWFPVYLLVIFLFNVWLGVLATAGAVLLIGLACLNECHDQKALGRSRRLFPEVQPTGHQSPA